MNRPHPIAPVTRRVPTQSASTEREQAGTLPQRPISASSSSTDTSAENAVTPPSLVLIGLLGAVPWLCLLVIWGAAK